MFERCQKHLAGGCLNPTHCQGDSGAQGSDSQPAAQLWAPVLVGFVLLLVQLQVCQGDSESVRNRGLLLAQNTWEALVIEPFFENIAIFSGKCLFLHAGATR